MSGKLVSFWRIWMVLKLECFWVVPNIEGQRDICKRAPRMVLLTWNYLSHGDCKNHWGKQYKHLEELQHCNKYKMQDLLPEYPLLTTKMIFSVHLEATIVFRTCELVYVNIWIFFWRWFWRRYGRISSYRFSTGFFYQIILYRDLLLQATALAGYNVPSTEFSTQYHYYYPLHSGLRVFKYRNGPNRSNCRQNCPPKYQNRLWRKVPTFFICSSWFLPKNIETV